MNVGELGHGVTDFLVDRSGHFPALHVRDRDVHVRRGHRRGERLVAIRHRHHDVGLEVVEHGRQLEQSQAGALGHGGRRLSLEHDEHARGNFEPVRFDDARHVAVTIEQRRRRQHELKLEIGVVGDGFERRLDPAVAGTGGDDNADFPASHSTSSKSHS
jgi:hypothetical protein